jgi:hypothetical protein
MIGMGASSTIQVITSLIAVILYAGTYLSFVRILRYPRSWYLPSLPTAFATGLLAVLTLAFVSLSPVGLDLISFTISAAFIAAMSFIIAAPAIAFQPANRSIEFLAKHAEYAGLWLLAPALAACLAVPNIKLQSMLASAMVIELSWFLRQRWAGRHRQLYLLNDSDLSVLKAQAKGDLKAFRLSHGIRELVLSEGAVSWRGCAKNMSPCPFNFYVNRLGLNTAPCCREHMRDISHYVVNCLSEMGAVHWLEGGTLLGAMRENGALLEWEDDVDISVLLDAEMTWDHLTAVLTERGACDGYFVNNFKNKSFISISFDTPKSWPLKWERNRLRGEVRVDIALYRRSTSFGVEVLERQKPKGNMPTTESGAYGVPKEIVLPTSTINFLGRTVACPNRSDSYLRMLYGDFEEVEYTYVDAAAAKTRHQVELVSKTEMKAPLDG